MEVNGWAVMGFPLLVELTAEHLVFN